MAAAVTAAAKKEGWRPAAALIEKNWDAFANEAPQHLLAALKALPGEAFVETPGLLVAASYLQQVTVNGEPSRFFHDARLEPQLRDDDSGDLNTLILLTGQAASARTAGRLDEARSAAEQARDMLLAMPAAQRAPMVGSLPHLRFQWARTLDVTDAPGALPEYEASYELARLTGQSVIARRAAGHIAWHHAERGRLQRAELWLARANGEPATNSRYDAIVFLTSALLRYDRGEKDASQHLGRALGLPLGEHRAAATWLAAMLAHTQHAASSVHSELEAELERHPEVHDLRGANGRYIKAARARLARLRPRLRVDLPLPDPPGALDLLLAGVQAYRGGRPSEAIARSEAATGLTAAPRVEAPAHLIAAASHLLLGHTGLAVDSFRLANAIIGRERLFSAYGFIPPDAASALADLAGETLHGTDNAPSDPKLPTLTKREREVLDLLATGLPMGRLAAQLYISPNTLKATVRALYRKLGVTSRQQAVDAARRRPR
ncbi:helix-turn-helix transcriptional regulator [Leifsonia virtsii]|uniref:LuxR C-terminal-related transcriptional regulator n=1 Tax=Leifsonia virtsii TaxID=3035915 RepID=A0ABT8IV87_9MICO|nr:LuxR C-terminal-related transcriptional regulator [Leifsonia virtsii]MDN4596727.1 LuxR C-terminal-related transcriptional regulator [Leifsonia virtsii]